MQSSNPNDHHKPPLPSAPPPESGQNDQPLPPQQFVQYYAPPPAAAPPQFVHYVPPPPPLQQPQQQSYGQYATTGLPFQPTSTLAPWSTGICDCWSDVPNCCLTCWCPCITFGQIAEIVDKGSTSCGVHGVLYALINLTTGLGCIYSCIYRTKMRRQYLLPESPCNDCLVHCFCQSCALCQEYRELQHRGFDISIGWDGNAERQSQRGVTTPPVAHSGMNR